MKEVILVADHPTNTTRLDILNNTISYLKNSGKKIALSSHILVPNFIINKCDYFIYDKENHYHFFDEHENSPRQELHLLNRVFKSHEFIVSDKNKDYKYSCFKQFISSTLYLKNLGYDLIHYIEGDTQVPLDEIKNNSSIIFDKKFDSVIYTSEKCMCGNFFSFTTHEINSELLPNISENFFYEKMKSSIFLENFIREIISKTPFVKKQDDYCFMKTDISNSFIKTKQSFFNIDGVWTFLIWNLTNNNINIEYISSLGELNKSFELEPYLCDLVQISPFTDNQKFVILLDDSIVKKYNLEPNMDEFKFNTCIKKEL